MEYTAVIRTLGKAGEKYRCLLDSLVNQTIKPSRILVYIAEGYAIPKETIGWEEYIYVKKGMVAQRALDYREVETEYILFLDDDVYLPPDGVEYLFNAMKQYDGDVISPDVFNNAGRSTKQEIPLILSGRISVRYKDNTWGYKVMRNGGYSYNKHPRPIMKSQTNAGPCFLCKKNDFEKIRFQEELWLDDMPYALGEDQTMFYKMFLSGLNVLTSYDSGIKHLDAGTTIKNAEKEKVLAFCDCRFKLIFWKRFLFDNVTRANKVVNLICFVYTMIINLLISLIKGNTTIFKQKYSGYRSGFQFLKTNSAK